MTPSCRWLPFLALRRSRNMSHSIPRQSQYCTVRRLAGWLAGSKASPPISADEMDSWCAMRPSRCPGWLAELADLLPVGLYRPAVPARRIPLRQAMILDQYVARPSPK